MLDWCVRGMELSGTRCVRQLLLGVNVTDEGPSLLVALRQNFAVASKGKDGNGAGNNCMGERELRRQEVGLTCWTRKSSGLCAPLRAVVPWILGSRLDKPPSDLTQLCHMNAFSWILI